jgi:hypothetical protein
VVDVFFPNVARAIAVGIPAAVSIAAEPIAVFVLRCSIAAKVRVEIPAAVVAVFIVTIRIVVAVLESEIAGSTTIRVPAYESVGKPELGKARGGIAEIAVVWTAVLVETITGATELHGPALTVVDFAKESTRALAVVEERLAAWVLADHQASMMGRPAAVISSGD